MDHHFIKDRYTPEEWQHCFELSQKCDRWDDGLGDRNRIAFQASSQCPRCPNCDVPDQTLHLFCCGHELCPYCGKNFSGCRCEESRLD